MGVGDKQHLEGTQGSRHPPHFNASTDQGVGFRQPGQNGPCEKTSAECALREEREYCNGNEHFRSSSIEGSVLKQEWNICGPPGVATGALGAWQHLASHRLPFLALSRGKQK